jgi:hypothetical protein
MPRIAHHLLIVLLLCSASAAWAQDGDVSLGDLARSLRKSNPRLEPTVIDNDNFAVMMDKAESARLSGQPVITVEPSGKAFHMISPDGSCSLSFDARSYAPNSAAYVSSDLPQDELLKLQGPAAIRDDQLEVTIHNGSNWELKEIVVGLTVLQAKAIPEIQPAKLSEGEEIAAAERSPDMTVLYHLKGAGGPDSTAVFTGGLGGSFADSKDWHWAIVGARGIPPASASPSSSTPMPTSPALSGPMLDSASTPASSSSQLQK